MQTSFIFKVIKKLLTALEITHDAGYIYNDIKIENIMIHSGKNKHEPKLILVDYGMAQKYTDENGNHLDN